MAAGGADGCLAGQEVIEENVNTARSFHQHHRLWAIVNS